MVPEPDFSIKSQDKSAVENTKAIRIKLLLTVPLMVIFSSPAIALSLKVLSFKAGFEVLIVFFVDCEYKCNNTTIYYFSMLQEITNLLLHEDENIVR